MGKCGFVNGTLSYIWKDLPKFKNQKLIRTPNKLSNYHFILPITWLYEVLLKNLKDLHWLYFFSDSFAIIDHINCICLTFSHVCFQMSSQMACLWGCIITLVAFDWFFSTVCSQMCLQSACIRGCKVTLAAFFRLFSIVCL